MAYGPELSRADVEALKPEAKGRHVRLGGLPRLSIYVSPSGSKSYHVGFRVRGVGQSRRMFLGRHPIISPQEAYAAARTILAARDLGRDPQAELQQKMAEAKRDRAETLAALVPLFLEKHCANLRSRDDIERVFKIYVVPRLGDRPLRRIERKDVVAMIDAIETRHGKASARRAYGWLRTFFTWAQGRDLVDRQPCDGIALPAQVARDRTFSDAEITLYWRAASRLPLAYSTYLKLLLMLGQRRTATASMRWEDLDLTAGKATWTIPAAIDKTGKAQLVPLPDLAARMIDKLPRIGKHVFARDATPAGDAPITTYSHLKRALLREMAAVDPVLAGKMAQFGLHDCRRSMRTRLSSIGIEASLAERLIGHEVGGGIVKVYDRWAYADEKRAAMEKWTAELLRLVEPPLTVVATAS
jgi:integrase